MGLRSNVEIVFVIVSEERSGACGSVTVGIFPKYLYCIATVRTRYIKPEEDKEHDEIVILDPKKRSTKFIAGSHGREEKK